MRIPMEFHSYPKSRQIKTHQESRTAYRPAQNYGCHSVGTNWRHSINSCDSEVRRCRTPLNLCGGSPLKSHDYRQSTRPSWSPTRLFCSPTTQRVNTTGQSHLATPGGNPGTTYRTERPQAWCSTPRPARTCALEGVDPCGMGGRSCQLDTRLERSCEPEVRSCGPKLRSATTRTGRSCSPCQRECCRCGCSPCSCRCGGEVRRCRSRTKSRPVRPRDERNPALLTCFPEPPLRERDSGRDGSCDRCMEGREDTDILQVKDKYIDPNGCCKIPKAVWCRPESETARVKCCGKASGKKIKQPVIACGVPACPLPKYPYRYSSAGPSRSNGTKKERIIKQCVIQLTKEKQKLSSQREIAQRKADLTLKYGALGAADCKGQVKDVPHGLNDILHVPYSASSEFSQYVTDTLHPGWREMPEYRQRKFFHMAPMERPMDVLTAFEKEKSKEPKSINPLKHPDTRLQYFPLRKYAGTLGHYV